MVIKTIQNGKSIIKAWELKLKGADERQINKVHEDLKYRLDSNHNRCLADVKPTLADSHKPGTSFLIWFKHPKKQNAKQQQGSVDEWARQVLHPGKWSWQMKPKELPTSGRPTPRPDGAIWATDYGALQCQLETTGFCLLNQAVPLWAVQALEQCIRTHTAATLVSMGQDCNSAGCSDLLGFKRWLCCNVLFSNFVTYTSAAAVFAFVFRPNLSSQKGNRPPCYTILHRQFSRKGHQVLVVDCVGP